MFTKYVVEADRWFQVRVVPHQDGLSFFATDVTATRAAELERERALTRPDQARAVLAYSAGLAEADTLADVIEVVATMVLPAFGATGMLVSLLESNRLKLAGHSGYSQPAVELLDVLSPDEDLPIAEVLRTRDPLFLPSRAAYYGKYPGRAELIEATGKQAWAFLPLTVSGRALGSLTVSFDQPRDFPPDERSLLVSVSGAAGPDPRPRPAARPRAHPGRRAAAAAAAARAAAARRGWSPPPATWPPPTAWGSAATGTTCWSCRATGSPSSSATCRATPCRPPR